MSDLRDVEICRLQEECGCLRAEIERLRVTIEQLHAAGNVSIAEIERLTARLEAAVLMVMDQATKIERLRTALQAIDGINDNPAVYRKDINDIIESVLPRPTP